MDFEDSAIHQAILDNNTELLEDLVKSDNVNLRGYDGSSFLHIAIDQGAHTDIVRLLLAKIDISFRDENGDTALDMAIIRDAGQVRWLILAHIGCLVIEGNVSMMEYLLQQGWDAWPVDVEEVNEIGQEMGNFFTNLPALQVSLGSI